MPAQLSPFVTSTLCACVYFHRKVNYGPANSPLHTACEAVLAPQPVCAFGEKYFASARCRISNQQFAHSQQRLSYSGCFPRWVSYVARKNVLSFRLASQLRHFCLHYFVLFVITLIHNLATCYMINVGYLSRVNAPYGP
jgi:hypothetical protein